MFYENRQMMRSGLASNGMENDLGFYQQNKQHIKANHAPL